MVTFLNSNTFFYLFINVSMLTTENVHLKIKLLIFMVHILLMLSGWNVAFNLRKWNADEVVVILMKWVTLIGYPCIRYSDKNSKYFLKKLHFTFNSTLTYHFVKYLLHLLVKKNVEWFSQKKQPMHIFLWLGWANFYTV